MRSIVSSLSSRIENDRVCSLIGSARFSMLKAFTIRVMATPKKAEKMHGAADSKNAYLF